MEPGAHPIEELEVDTVAARLSALARLRAKRLRATEALAELHEEAQACISLGLQEPAQFALSRVRAAA